MPTRLPTVGRPSSVSSLEGGKFMTHREYFNGRKKAFFMWFAACWIVAIVCTVLSVSVHDLFFLATLAVFPVTFLMFYITVLFRVKCPNCGGQWGWIAIYSGSPVAIRRGLRCCPYCGVDLDEEIPSARAS